MKLIYDKVRNEVKNKKKDKTIYVNKGTKIINWNSLKGERFEYNRFNVCPQREKFLL